MCVSVLNVAIVRPNFYLYKRNSIPLIVVEEHNILLAVNDIGGYASMPTTSISPSSYWLFWAINWCTICSIIAIVIVFSSKVHLIMNSHWISSGSWNPPTVSLYLSLADSTLNCSYWRKMFVPLANFMSMHPHFPTTLTSETMEGPQPIPKLTS